MQSTPSLPLLPGPDKVLSMGKIELKYILMLNWITWNKIIFDIETVLMLNWVFEIELFLTLKLNLY